MAAGNLVILDCYCMYLSNGTIFRGQICIEKIKKHLDKLL